MGIFRVDFPNDYKFEGQLKGGEKELNAIEIGGARFIYGDRNIIDRSKEDQVDFLVNMSSILKSSLAKLLEDSPLSELRLYQTREITRKVVESYFLGLEEGDFEKIIALHSRTANRCLQACRNVLELTANYSQYRADIYLKYNTTHFLSHYVVLIEDIDAGLCAILSPANILNKYGSMPVIEGKVFNRHRDIIVAQNSLQAFFLLDRIEDSRPEMKLSSYQPQWNKV